MVKRPLEETIRVMGNHIQKLEDNAVENRDENSMLIGVITSNFGKHTKEVMELYRNKPKGKPNASHRQ